MAVIKYSVKENRNVGTHSFYAQAQSYSTLDLKDLAEEISEGVGISKYVTLTILQRYADVAQREVLRGHRVKLGELLTLYPQITASVKDEVDDKGNVIKPVTIDKFTLANAKSTIGATISLDVQKSFAKSVSWKRVGEDDVNAKNDSKPTTPSSPSSPTSPSGTGGTDTGGSTGEQTGESGTGETGTGGQESPGENE